MADTRMDRATAAEVLGVDMDADHDQVAAAYRRYVRNHHPDSDINHDERGSATAGAILAKAASARECLLGSQRLDDRPADPDRSTRSRTFHQSSPWWRRMMSWRHP